jgi:glucose-6-phosphate-specific signal transduction histidine kinase
VSYEPGYVTVSVTDTGHGPIAVTVGQQVEQASVPSQNGTNGGSVGKAAVIASGGFGLAGIAERVASCGGSLTVGPGRAGGFAVTAKLPTP